MRRSSLPEINSKDGSFERSSAQSKKPRNIKAASTFFGAALMHKYHRLSNVAGEYNPVRIHPTPELRRFHGPAGIFELEGFMRRGQTQWFRETLFLNPQVKKIAEIGFNGGHSSYTFLTQREGISVTSFDIGAHDYVVPTSKWMSQQFPGRHKLVLGDSKETVPKYAARHPDDTYDLIFIDGGHDLKTSWGDIKNMRNLAAPGALVVVDDYGPENAEWGEGPMSAWDAAVSERLVVQHGIESADRRTWAYGQYLGQPA